MRTLTIEQINELEHGEIIPSFQGRITKVFDQKTGEGNYGPWHLQTMMVGEGQHEISVTWTGEDTFNDWEGALVAFECSENKQGKLVGILRDIRIDKQGKEWRGVKVTPAAKIKRLNGETTETAAAPKPVPNDSEKPGSAKPNGSLKILEYAAHSSRIFQAAWDEAAVISKLIAPKDGEEMSAYEWNDLRMRLAQGFAIEINKIIRKERF